MIGIHYTGSNEQTVDQVVQDLSDPTGAKHCNKSCSVQLTVDPKGNVYQLTSSLNVITENIINFNDADIGIEIMGADEQTLLNNSTQFNAVVSTVAQLMKQYNIKMVQDFSTKSGLMGHIECDQWSQAHLGSHFGGIYSADPPVESTDSHTDPGGTYMSKLRAAVGPQLN
ncbi:MAG TPA: N-acetylmuramoyl-L-alanine amidase, partial [Candidatus Saccharimonadales bacterium]